MSTVIEKAVDVYTRIPSKSPAELMLPWMTADLAKSGISPERAVALGFEAVGPDRYEDLLGISGSGLSAGYVIPFRDPESEQPMQTHDGRQFVRVKLKESTKWTDKRDGTPSSIKYLSPKDGGQHAYIPPSAHRAILNEGWPVILTEGEKKAVAACDAGRQMIGLCGNYGYLGRDGDLLSELARYTGVQKQWYAVWDDDASGNPDFVKATQRLADLLAQYGCELKVVILPTLGDMKTGVDDYLLHPEGGCQRLGELIQKEAQIVHADWPDLATKPAYEPLPAFPMDAVPSPLRAMAGEIVRSDQVAPEAAALLVLSVAGLAAGGRHRASIKPGVSSRANLYVLMFLGVGERKSTIYGRALCPVEDWMRERKEEWDRAVEQRAVQEQRITNLQKRLVDIHAEPEDLETTNELIDAERERIPQVRSPMILADDSTIEALTSQMEQTAGLLGVFSDDARQFLQILTGRYSDGRCQEGLFLKSYDGGAPLRSDRRSRQPIVIEIPCIATFLMVQLDWLQKIGRAQDLSHSGFLSRCIFCVPDPLAGTRDDDGNLRRAFTEYQIDPNVQQRYGALIRGLLDHAFEMAEVQEVPVDHDARVLWVRFYNAIEAEMGADGSLHHIVDIAKRYPAQALRIALIGALCRGASSISALDMRNAIRLVTYFAEHAERAFQAMRQMTLPKNPERIVAFLKRNHIRDFTEADIQRRVGGMDRTEVADAVQWLVANSYCRPVSETREGPGRKPSPRYAVNPNLHIGRRA